MTTTAGPPTKLKDQDARRTQVGMITTIAGTGYASFGGDGGDAANAYLYSPSTVIADGDGNIYIADAFNYRVRQISPDGTIMTVAGNGQSGYTGEGQATSVAVSPTGLALDDSGDLYIADSQNQRVRNVTADGVISTFAGTGRPGYSGDGGQATAAALNLYYSSYYQTAIAGVAQDKSGNLYIADQCNHRIRKVATSGVITTVAGNGTAGFSGDGGPAIRAQLNYPTGIAVDDAANLYIADRVNHRIRKVSASGTITTIAGDGTAGFNGDGQATSARLNYPADVTVDDDGHIFVADTWNHRVRRIATNKTITTIAGTGSPGYSGDGGNGPAAQLYYPTGVAVDADGNVYIADTSNNRVRKVSAVDGKAAPKHGADLWGEAVNPATMQTGIAFDLGARVKNRGPGTASGNDIEITLTLPKELAGPAGPGQSCTRTFPGAQLPPNQGSLDGTFHVIAPLATPSGTYTATAQIVYTDETNPVDNTISLPVTIVNPEPMGDEQALEIAQTTIPKAKPGGQATMTVELTSAVHQPVNPGVIEMDFTTPTNFIFTGAVTITYKLHNGTSTSDNHTYPVEDNGTTLTIVDNPHVNTTSSDHGSLVYTFAVKAKKTAKPGDYDGGVASIGDHPNVPLTGTIQ
jgi:sugar lactone lactonase YvrE